MAIYFTLPDVGYLKRTNPGMSAVMKQRIMEAKRQGKKHFIHHKWVNFADVPLLLKQTVRISEDDAFYQHKGIDFRELANSLKRNISEGRFARGGSTITQQLAKNLFLSTEKSLLRKIKEYFLAKKLESVLTKNRIFELYLNYIEFGRGIFGVEKAANIYFNKSVRQLQLNEIIRLVSIIPKPLRANPKGDSRFLKWRSRLLLHRLFRYGYIDQITYFNTVVEFKKIIK